MVTVLTPTRQRADLWFKNIRQCFEKSKTDPEFLTYVDNDDPELEKYKNYAKELTDLDLKMIIGKPMHSARAIKYLAQNAKHNYLFWGTDDLDWETDAWDEKLISYMPEHGLSVVFPSANKTQGGKWFLQAKIPFHTKRWVEITGLYPDVFVHFGPDGWVSRIADLSGQSIHAEDVHIFHHKKIGDETSRRARAAPHANWSAILDERHKEIKQAVIRVQTEINDYEQRKQA